MFKLLRYLKPDAKNIIAVVMLALVESAASLALPYLMSFIVKNGINALDMRVTLYAAGGHYFV